MTALWQDLRLALRSLVRRPAFAAAVIITFALGIGANTAIFSIVNATLIQPLPYQESNRRAFVWGDLSSAGYPCGPMSGPELIDLRRYATLFTSFAGIWQSSAVITGDGDPAQLRIGFVTANFFRTLGVSAAIGRAFEDSDEGQKAYPSILLNWAVLAGSLRRGLQCCREGHYGVGTAAARYRGHASGFPAPVSSGSERAGRSRSMDSIRRRSGAPSAAAEFSARRGAHEARRESCTSA